MSELLAGGLISILTALVLSIVDTVKAVFKERHEEEMFRLKFFLEHRQQILEDYMEKLGTLQDKIVMSGFDSSGYFAAFEKACLVVSPKTREAMNALNANILEIGVQAQFSRALADLPAFVECLYVVRERLYGELRLSK